MTDAPLDWFDTWLLGREGLLGDTPVKVHVQGECGRWRDLPDWPPPRSQPAGISMPGAGWRPSRRRHRRSPTVTATTLPTRRRRWRHRMLTGGAVDNRPLEARSDVLVYTSDELDEPLQLIGPVDVELCVSSSLSTPTSSSECATCLPTAGL